MSTKWIVVWIALLSLLQLPLTSNARNRYHNQSYRHASMPSEISPTGEKVIIVDPNIHAFGAYDADGRLLRSGMATAEQPCWSEFNSFLWN